MKVYYDYQILRLQSYGGISRYYYDLFSTIKNGNLAEVRIRCYYSLNEYFGELFGKINKPPKTRLRAYCHTRINRFIVYWEMKRKYDIVHPTYYDPYILKLKGNSKLVITVYDMIHELFPELLNDYKLIEEKKTMLYAADGIIAISENTKRDILKYYPDINPQKIKVIYLASNFNPQKHSDCTDANLGGKYILFVGNRGLYKNFLRFVKSVMPILDEDEELYIVCAGGPSFTGDEIKSLGKYYNRFKKIQADNDTLYMAYNNAMCFVFPSLYEGFGIPVLEAFACDCPVLLSNTSSFPEVGGDAAIYFDPRNEGEMREKIKAVLNDADLRKKLKSLGRKQLEKFSWQNIAEQTISYYESLI